MKYKLKYIAKEYKHGWTVWLERDEQKFQIGSKIKNEKEVNKLINKIGIEKQPIPSWQEYKEALDQVEKLQYDVEYLTKLLRNQGCNL